MNFDDIKEMLKAVFIRSNPLILWGRWLINYLSILGSNTGKKLRVGYFSYFYRVNFGFYNTISDKALLCDVNIGDFSYVGSNTEISNVSIGKYCSIGPDCKIGLSRHPTDTCVSTHPIFFSTKKQAQITFSNKDYFSESNCINIGNDVWIGANVLIVDGIVIGDGAIIAAGAVVVKDVPPYAIVGGVPAKLIRYRFCESDISLLLKMRWWDRDVSYLKNNYLLFHDIANFR